MFRVTKAKGKAISNGGFGVSWAVKTLNNESSSPDQYITSDYLFIEEVLFLHERGMIDVFVPSEKDPELASAKSPIHADSLSSIKPVDTQDLYDMMLHELNVPLSVYLVYAHLRSQTFIAVRHTVHRSELIKKIEDKCKGSSAKENAISEKENNEAEDVEFKIREEDDNREWKKKRKCSALASLKKDLRKDAFEAPIPAILRDQNFSFYPHNGNDTDNNNAEESTVGISNKEFTAWNSCIAFDCYNPNGSFRKSNPGQPDFYVSITPFAEPSPTISTFNKIIKSCGNTSFRVASVSDGGTVVMFSITDVGVPTIC